MTADDQIKAPIKYVQVERSKYPQADYMCFAILQLLYTVYLHVYTAGGDSIRLLYLDRCCDCAAQRPAVHDLSGEASIGRRSYRKNEVIALNSWQLGCRNRSTEPSDAQLPRRVYVISSYGLL